MRLLFQGEAISHDSNLPDHLLRRLSDGSDKLMAVGYYYSPETGYVLMLPNAFKKQRETIVNEWELLTTVHFMLERYVGDAGGKSVDQHHRFQMPEQGTRREESFLDTLIRIREFFRRNSGFFFTHIARSLQPHGVIDWSATVPRGKEMVVNNGADVLYPAPVYARQDIDVDHRLFVLFLSIVRYVKKYGCRIAVEFDIDLLPDKELEGLCADKRGCRLLKSIRDMYFSDIALEMWQLCYDFFDRNVDTRSEGHEEYFYTQSFQLVFEKMVDTIIADPDEARKYSSAWARIDHVFEGLDPAIPDSTTLYILDSKCYEEKEEKGERRETLSGFRSNLHHDSDSAHKQKAYVDKIYGDVAKRGGTTENGIQLLDYENESHRFIPNCFIVPGNDEMVDDASSNGHEKDVVTSGQMTGHFQYSHWKHCPLFVITTKYIFIFHIDLRRLMKVYAAYDNLGSATLREDFRKKMHDQIAEFLHEKYDFGIPDPRPGERFLNTTARLKI